jgi:hypothetical protein
MRDSDMPQDLTIAGTIEDIKYLLASAGQPAFLVSFPRNVNVRGKLPSFKLGDAIEATVVNNGARAIKVTAEAKYPLLHLGGEPQGTQDITATIVEISITLKEETSNMVRRLVADKNTDLPGLKPGDKASIKLTPTNEILGLTGG